MEEWQAPVRERNSHNSNARSSFNDGEFNRAFQSDFYGEELMEAEWCSDRKQGARSKERRRMVETGSRMEGYQGSRE
ncbi:hypothetical protein PVK06_046908 [Gossypium arboreum]|uniref:Uncharacterized protein n=1 Tax=Gossypium arboreum TaxID=29729 RepID=A0ABR0MBY2_GOSAR|nr:hypothetical protein PVK06_046908 [Gossypium arboreum]